MITTYFQEFVRLIIGLIRDIYSAKCRVNGGSEAIFVPGKLSPDGTKFVKAENACDMAMRRIAEDGTTMPPPPFDANSLSIVFKKRRPTNGFMVKRKGKVPKLAQLDPRSSQIF